MASSLYFISGINILELGAPAGWLIASSVDKKIAQQRYKIRFNCIGLDELRREYENADLASSLNIIEHLSRRCAFKVELEEVRKFLRLYFAIRNILEREESRVSTIPCFNVFKLPGVTPCWLFLSLILRDSLEAARVMNKQSLLSAFFLDFPADPSLWVNVANQISRKIV